MQTSKHLWLPLAKQLAPQTKLRWKHCGKDAAADIHNNLKAYNMFCHRCGANEFHLHADMTFKERMQIKKLATEAEHVLQRTTISLPKDFTYDIPLVGMLWLLKASITPAMALKHHIGWTPRYQRVVLPIYDSKGKLIFTQNRAVLDGQEPKYLNPRVDREAIVYLVKPNADLDTIVVVEAVLSAIRVGQFVPTCSLLGSKISLRQAALLTKYKHIIIWLDPDHAGVEGTKKIRKLTSLVTKTTVITTDKKPKQYSNADIQEIIKCHKHES